MVEHCDTLLSRHECKNVGDARCGEVWSPSPVDYLIDDDEWFQVLAAVLVLLELC